MRRLRLVQSRLLASQPPMSFHVRVTPITELPSRPLFSNPSGARVPCAIDNATRIEVDAARASGIDCQA
jgi:hypothetical protein